MDIGELDKPDYRVKMAQTQRFVDSGVNNARQFLWQPFLAGPDGYRYRRYRIQASSGQPGY